MKRRSAAGIAAILAFIGLGLWGVELSKYNDMPPELLKAEESIEEADRERPRDPSPVPAEHAGARASGVQDGANRLGTAERAVAPPTAGSEMTERVAEGLQHLSSLEATAERRAVVLEISGLQPVAELQAALIARHAVAKTEREQDLLTGLIAHTSAEGQVAQVRALAVSTKDEEVFAALAYALQKVPGEEMNRALLELIHDNQLEGAGAEGEFNRLAYGTLATILNDRLGRGDFPWIMEHAETPGFTDTQASLLLPTLTRFSGENSLKIAEALEARVTTPTVEARTQVALADIRRQLANQR